MVNKLGAACGILHALLVPIGFSILTAGGAVVTDLDSTPEEIAAGLDSPPGSALWVGGYLECCAFLLFIVFAAWLRDRLRAAGDESWLPDAAYGAAVVLVGLGMLSFTTGGVFYLLAGTEVDTGAGVALMYVRTLAFTITFLVYALFLAAAAGSALRTGVLGRPLTWMAAVLAPAFLLAAAAPKTDMAQLPGFVVLLWILVVSISLLRRPDTHATASARASVGDLSSTR